MEYDDIFLYLKETKYFYGKNNDKRILRGKAKNIVLGSHDNLYYIEDSRKKQVVTHERLISVLRLCNVNCGSHLGRDKTNHKVKKEGINNIYKGRKIPNEQDSFEETTTVEETINIITIKESFNQLAHQLVSAILLARFAAQDLTTEDWHTSDEV
ncbi:Hypothetical predicted protein [Mytilus galloprovincialis]|uniref:Uncharacterized protein n=1 Tax=Mytilus galloprovincialis TaxID=29158 RepID=A0A8B6DJM3_MYTGA|nr:Hypothetical predicted protein [Mytilus galloprovincialis]